jgi:hypothetical protein
MKHIERVLLHRVRLRFTKANVDAARGAAPAGGGHASPGATPSFYAVAGCHGLLLAAIL